MFLESVLFTCLAWNVYFESRGEAFAGQVAVAEVTLRRTAQSSRTVCHEVFDDHQFEWTLALKDPTVRNKAAWARAQEAADAALSGTTNESLGATHFHNTTLSKPPKSWMKLCVVRRIDKHVFYKPCLGSSPRS